MTIRRKQKAAAWALANFTDDSRPSINTVKKWINEGTIDGIIIGGLYYVYEDQSAPCAPATARQANDLVASFMSRNVQ